MTEMAILNKIVTTCYAMLKPNQEEIFKESLFYKKLDFNNIQLTDNDIKIIKYFLDFSFKENKILDSIEFEKIELEKNIQLSKEEIEDFIDKLEPNILEINISTGSFKLNYSIFWKTNYLQITENKLHFIDLLIGFINFLKDENLLKYGFENEIKIRDLLNRNIPFNYEQLNAILIYLKEKKFIVQISRTYNCENILESFYLDKNNKLSEITNNI